MKEYIFIRKKLTLGMFQFKLNRTEKLYNCNLMVVKIGQDFQDFVEDDISAVSMTPFLLPSSPT